MSIPSTLPATLEYLADLSEIQGASGHAADLRRAAAMLGALDARAAARLVQKVCREGAVEAAAVAPDVRWRLRELALGGADVVIQAAHAGVPQLLRRLLELSAVASSQAVRLVQQLDVLTLPDLAAALDEGRVAHVMDEAGVTRVRRAAAALELEQRPTSVGRAAELVESWIAAVAGACPFIEDLAAAGDLRRFEPLVSTIVVVGRAVDPPAAVEALCALSGVAHVRHKRGGRAVVVVQEAEIDIRIAPPDDYGSRLFSATGSRAHVTAVLGRRGRQATAAHEADIYQQTGLAFIPPELRQDTGEIEAAAAGRLPALIAREHIRGDLHMHSIFSDGTDAVEVMVAACCALGYAYMAITDHSERAAAGRTVTLDQLARQRDEIARLRERYPAIAILHGIEVDILPDGRLDFADAILEPLDIVLASLHDTAGQDPARLTWRCLEAIRHPLVAVITHPANQLVGRRPGYALDFGAIYDAAAETGTALEIDGAPSHLDLDGEHARAAIAAGVTVTIDSDCHRVQSLDRQMRLGVGTARRGWVEPRHVLNARPIEDVRAFVRAKRTRGR